MTAPRGPGSGNVPEPGTTVPDAPSSSPGASSRRTTLRFPAVGGGGRASDPGIAPPETRLAPPLEPRRNTLRMAAVQMPGAPPSRPTVPPHERPPGSKPTGSESETYGRIHRIVVWLDAHKGAFTISRLISQTGVNLRSFAADTKDDARVLSRLWPMLDVLLTEDERDQLLRALREA